MPIGTYLDAGSGTLHGQDRLSGSQSRAPGYRKLQIGGDTLLGPQISGGGFHGNGMVVRKSEHGKSFGRLRVAEIFQRQIMKSGRFVGTIGHSRTGRPRHHEVPSHDQFSIHFIGQLFPQHPRPVQQRNVTGMFEIRFANQPSLTMRAPSVMRRLKTIDSDHVQAATCQMVNGRRSESARANHQHVARFNTHFLHNS